MRQAACFPHVRLFRRLTIAALAASTLLLAPLQAVAQDAYPTRAVRIIVPYSPGGSNDTTARILAARLVDVLGQQFVVENRPGAAGDLGGEFVARAAPDGYTLLLASGSMIISAALKARPSYRPLYDFEHMVLLTSFSQTLLVAPSFGTPDLKSFVEKVKKAPGKYNYATTGIGSIQHAVIAAFLDVAGLDMVQVPYPGAGQANLDVIAGVTTLGAASPTTMKTAGLSSLIPLAIAGPKRNPSFAQVPTIAESGYPEFDKLSSWLTWQAMIAPKGTPRPIVDKLNAAINKVLDEADTRKKFETLGQDSIIGSTPETTHAFFKKETDDWEALVKRLGLKVQ